MQPESLRTERAQLPSAVNQLMCIGFQARQNPRPPRTIAGRNGTKTSVVTAPQRRARDESQFRPSIVTRQESSHCHINKGLLRICRLSPFCPWGWRGMRKEFPSQGLLRLSRPRWTLPPYQTLPALGGCAPGRVGWCRSMDGASSVHGIGMDRTEGNGTGRPLPGNGPRTGMGHERAGSPPIDRGRSAERPQSGGAVSGPVGPRGRHRARCRFILGKQARYLSQWLGLPAHAQGAGHPYRAG